MFYVRKYIINFHHYVLQFSATVYNFKFSSLYHHYLNLSTEAAVEAKVGAVPKKPLVLVALT